MSPRRQRLTTIVLMGVAGTGKTTIMSALADRLGWPTLEGDSVHPESNVLKMAAGVPLTDADRAPWLDLIAAWIGRRERERANAIVTCSALRRRYRDRLRRGHPSVWFVHLAAPREAIEARMAGRTGHFMPASLLESQLATLEPLGPDEPGWAIDALASPAAIGDQIIARLGLDPG